MTTERYPQEHDMKRTSPNVIYLGDKLGGGTVTQVGPEGVYVEEDESGARLWGVPLTWERAYALRRGYK